MIDRWKNIAWVIFVIQAIDVVFILIDCVTGETVSIWETEGSFNLTGYLLGLIIVGLISSLMNYITQKIMFKLKKKSIAHKLWTILQWGVIIGSFFIIFMLLGNDQLNFLRLPSWVLMLVAGLFLLGYYTLNRERVKERKAHKISFWGMVKDEVDADSNGEFRKAMEKAFEKKNKKLQKKGKPEMTWSEYLDERDKEMKKALKWKWLYDWMPIIVTIPLGFVEYLNSGFGVDLVIYVLILLVSEFLCLKAMWKFVNWTICSNIGWLDVERRRIELLQEDEE